jgi:hypothetical protein
VLHTRHAVRTDDFSALRHKLDEDGPTFKLHLQLTVAAVAVVVVVVVFAIRRR